MEDEKDEHIESERRCENFHMINHTEESKNDINVDDPNACDPVRSEWARHELSEFRRPHRSSRPLHYHTQQPNSTHSQQQSDTYGTTPISTLDHPDLRLNGMFLPQ